MTSTGKQYKTEGTMLNIKTIPVPGYEKVFEITNSAVGLHAFVAIHDTTMGAALGGVRIYPYKKPADALKDVLRLAVGMTYKSAVVESGFGGGKSVIIIDPKVGKTEELLLAFGEAINKLEGVIIVAEDVGSSTEDMLIIRKKTPYVSALPTEKSSGDPSRFTAHGVFRSMQAVAMKIWGNPSLKNKVIAIQGLGHVGSRLASFLFWEEAKLIFTDIDTKKAHVLALKYGATEVSPDEYFDTECDILSPCALGGIFNADTIPRLKCKAIAGAANNQLLTHEDGQRLADHGILYAPDFISNSGGIINAAQEFEPEGYNPLKSRKKVDKIYDTLLDIFQKAELEKKPTDQVAEDLAEYKLKNKIGKRKAPLHFH